MTRNIEITILNQLRNYKGALGSFGSDAAILGHKQMDPGEWWATFGNEVPHLRAFAKRILSQTASSSGYEKNWCTFSLIHTKTRNRLTMHKLEKLIFVHYNMRLRARNLTRRDNGDYQPINLDYIFEEDDPLDEWLAEREDPVLNDRAFLDEAMADVEDFQSDERHNSPPQRPTRRSATPTSTAPSARDKGKGVATSSSQGSQHGHNREPKLTRSTSERVARARDRSTSTGSSGLVSKSKQWIKDPTFQYKRKLKDKSTHAKTSQSQRLVTHEEDEEHKTSSSSKSGSPEGGEQGQNEEAYEGSDGGGGGDDNINVYDPLHGGPSELAGGSRSWGRGEGNEPSDEHPGSHQMASGPWITSSDSSYDTGMGNNMDTHTMILRLSMGSRSSMVDTVVLHMGMGNNSMEYY